MSCSFLLYNKNESALRISISLPSRISLTHPHPTPLGHHQALSWAPCVIQQLPTSCLFYTCSYIRQCYSPSSSPLTFCQRMHMSVLWDSSYNRYNTWLAFQCTSQWQVGKPKTRKVRKQWTSRSRRLCPFFFHSITACYIRETSKGQNCSKVWSYQTKLYKDNHVGWLWEHLSKVTGQVPGRGV